MARTDPADVARVESKTVISTTNRSDTVPTPKEGTTGKLGFWMSPDQLSSSLKERFPGCMKGVYYYTGLNITTEPWPEACLFKG